MIEVSAVPSEVVVGGAMDVKPLSTAVITAELERRQADTLVMMAEYQPKDRNWQRASGKGCAGGKLLPL